jgi:hypothetical protein
MVRSEEEILRLIEKANWAKEHSTSRWSVNFWNTVLQRLKLRFPYGR